MKKIITLLLLLPSLVMAQLTTLNPDTVCYQTPGSVYQVPVTPGLAYSWTVSPPGILIAGQGSNTIQVDWSWANPGLIPNAIQVQATNAAGCLSPVVTLNVFIYQVIINITAISDLCESGNCVNLTSNIPGGTWLGVGVNVNQFCPSMSGIGIFGVTYTYTNAGCTFNNTISVNVVAQPQILPIQHN
jgi:hypothetical protein